MTTAGAIRFVARHAQVLRVPHLTYDERPLSQRGIEQALSLARFCALVRSPQVVTSSLSRSVDTAEIIARSAQCRIVVDSRLNELARKEDEGAIAAAVAVLYEDWPPSTLFVSHGGTLTALLNRLSPLPRQARDRHGSVLDHGELFAVTLPASSRSCRPT